MDKTEIAPALRAYLATRPAVEAAHGEEVLCTSGPLVGGLHFSTDFLDGVPVARFIGPYSAATYIEEKLGKRYHTTTLQFIGNPREDLVQYITCRADDTPFKVYAGAFGAFMRNSTVPALSARVYLARTDAEAAELAMGFCFDAFPTHYYEGHRADCMIIPDSCIAAAMSDQKKRS